MLSRMTDEQKLFIAIAYEDEGEDRALLYLSIMLGVKSNSLLVPKLNEILGELDIIYKEYI